MLKDKTNIQGKQTKLRGQRICKKKIERDECMYMHVYVCIRTHTHKYKILQPWANIACYKEH